MTVSDVKIQGMPVSAAFNVQTGALTTDDNSVADITPYVNSANNYREAIILPVALSDAYKVSFVLDGRTREWVFADLDISLPKFNAGSQYTFGIYIDPTEDIIIGRLEDVDAETVPLRGKMAAMKTVRRMGINLPSTISFQPIKQLMLLPIRN